METSQAIRFNMGGFKCRDGMLFSNSTLLISLFNCKPKRTLSQSMTEIDSVSGLVIGWNKKTRQEEKIVLFIR
jgi:hypothetical protein